MPLGRIGVGLGYSGPTPIVDYYGNTRDPNSAPSDADCLPFQCGASNNLAAILWCSFYGKSRSRAGCVDPECAGFRPSFCPPVYAPAAAPAASPSPLLGPAPMAPASAPPPVAQPTQQTPTPAPKPKPVTVETSTGPVVVSSDVVPGVADLQLVPAQVRVPNIWDSLDPSKASLFAYRGLQRSLPVWIGRNYRRSLLDASGSAASPAGANASGDGLPWVVWAVILGTAWALRDKHAPRARAARVRKVRAA
jgi:hypothetical protein